jgi:hypothetical protein
LLKLWLYTTAVVLALKEHDLVVRINYFNWFLWSVADGKVDPRLVRVYSCNLIWHLSIKLGLPSPTATLTEMWQVGAQPAARAVIIFQSIKKVFIEVISEQCISLNIMKSFCLLLSVLWALSDLCITGMRK